MAGKDFNRVVAPVVYSIYKSEEENNKAYCDAYGHKKSESHSQCLKCGVDLPYIPTIDEEW